MKITIIARKEYPELKKLRKNFKVVKNGDVYIAVGGDGTFIRAAEITNKPVLLIRDEERGSIGYHSDLGIKDMDFIVENLKKKNYYVESIANKIELIYKNRHYFAINEARLNNILEEVSFNVMEIKEGGKRSRIYPFIMSGDGVIITSKIGSTAYNQSAGGPIILTPEVLCLTFLNMNGPYENSIVVDSKRRIEVEVVKYKGRLIYDGTEVAKLGPGERFVIGLSKKEIRVVRFKGRKEEFSERLERKIKSRMVKEFRN